MGDYKSKGTLMGHAVAEADAVCEAATTNASGLEDDNADGLAFGLLLLHSSHDFVLCVFEPEGDEAATVPITYRQLGQECFSPV